MAEYFYTLSSILNIDFKKAMSTWLYGAYASVLLNQQATTQTAATIIEDICLGCGANLLVEITTKDQKSDGYWLIVKCNNCKQGSILSLPGNFHQLKLQNCSLAEQFPKDRFTEEEVREKMQRLRK